MPNALVSFVVKGILKEPQGKTVSSRYIVCQGMKISAILILCIVYSLLQKQESVRVDRCHLKLPHDFHSRGTALRLFSREAVDT
jgi:hypothetical protein